MSDNGEEEADEPVVELGDGPDVEGAPVSRVASRLFFPIERSEVLRREGETTVRTPDGPRTVGDVLEETDEVYFETSADLVNTVRSVVGTGPVPTAGGGSDSGGAGGADEAGDGTSGEDAGEADETDTGGDDVDADTDAESDSDTDAESDSDTDAEADVDAEEGEFEFGEE